MTRFAFLFIFVLIASFSTAKASESLFGSHETKYQTFNLFPKWVSVLSRHKHDLVKARATCESPTQTACLFLKWRSFLSTLKGKNRMQQLKAVNLYANKHKYITDLVNWGINDYWETPREFFLKDGDCEDFAIAKFESMLYLGVKNEDMRIVVLQDTNLNTAHAVLAVYVNGKPYILDNQVEQVVPASKIKHYMPIYSINETNWWRHS